MADTPYPPIGDYAFLADCHSTALVSREGSIDWCCMPRSDSGSVFGRLLDWQNGGWCKIAPATWKAVRRRYLPGTLVLETTFETEGGEVEVLDCFTMKRGGRREPNRQLLRIVQAKGGPVEVEIEVVARLDYGEIVPWIRRRGPDHVILGGSTGLLVSGDVPVERHGRDHLAATIRLEPGERRRLSIVFHRPELLDNGLVKAPTIAELDARYEETVRWWRRWVGQGRRTRIHPELTERSALVLKGLSNAPTGAIAAAATTSLPESPDGGRNWDYRYTWIRDSVFAVRSLAALGYVHEADEFRRFIERSSAGSADELQLMFGLGGERRLPEIVVPELEGYRGIGPVRTGNAAARQLQLDMYGELMDLVWRWHEAGNAPDDEYWTYLVGVVQAVCAQWSKPDHGMWEIRGTPQHFVHSKVTCWSALDRGITIARQLGRKCPIERWVRERDAIRAAVEEQGYDRGRGVFVQAFGSEELDAALLLLPTLGFVAWDDPRMVRTTDAVARDLCEHGLVRRYRHGTDDLEGYEGTFVACTFWLAECYARQGRREDALRVFERAIQTGNDLGLFAEEFDVHRRELMGNFPQALSHLSLITAAVALDRT